LGRGKEEGREENIAGLNNMQFVNIKKVAPWSAN
jgi:hypothetical protein